MHSAERALLIAPCGMDCAICSAYLADLHAVPQKRGAISYCAGCRIRNKRCAYLRGHCARLQRNEVRFYFECPDYPCQRLGHLDSRYRKKFRMSFIENLEVIRSSGVDQFIGQHQSRFGCQDCGGLRSVHKGKCFVCDNVRSGNT